MFDLQALSAFGYFGNGLTVPTGSHPVTQKLFWWLTGPSGIGAAHLDCRIKVAMFDLQALSALGYLQTTSILCCLCCRSWHAAHSATKLCFMFL